MLWEREIEYFHEQSSNWFFCLVRNISVYQFIRLSCDPRSSLYWLRWCPGWSSLSLELDKQDISDKSHLDIYPVWASKSIFWVGRLSSFVWDIGPGGLRHKIIQFGLFMSLGFESYGQTSENANWIIPCLTSFSENDYFGSVGPPNWINFVSDKIG